MKEIKSGVYIENAYPGVILGAIPMARGTLLIDAPTRPEDGRSWRTSVRSIGSSSQRLLVLLDSHPDRTLGARAMETPLIVQEETARIVGDRSAVFKASTAETGSEWEGFSGLSGTRWLRHTLTFSEGARITWGDHEVTLEYHPGVEPGAAWVAVHDLEVVFVGDTVVSKQPPFMARADIPVWLKTIDLLLAKPYKDYLIISGRSGPVSQKEIRDQRRFLAEVKLKLDRMSRRKTDPQTAGNLADRLQQRYKFPAKNSEMYLARMRHGISHYYAHHFRGAPLANTD